MVIDFINTTNYSPELELCSHLAGPGDGQIKMSLKHNGSALQVLYRCKINIRRCIRMYIYI